MSVHLVHGSKPVFVGEKIAEIVDDELKEKERTKGKGPSRKHTEVTALEAIEDVSLSSPQPMDRHLVSFFREEVFSDDELRLFRHYVSEPSPITDVIVGWPAGLAPGWLKQLVVESGGRLSLVNSFLVHGSDEALLSDKVAEIVRQLVGDEDRSLVLEEFAGDFVMAGATEAALTPPFFTERRVVVVRSNDGFVADDVAVLVDYLNDPPEFTDLVIAWGSGKVPDALKKAVTGGGGRVIDPSPPSKVADRREWWSEHIRSRELDLEPAAQAMLIEWLGEDVSRFDGLAHTLKSTYGSKRVSITMLEPYLGDRGDALPWDLTDAIDNGRAVEALRAARRMMRAGERHPLQILAQLHNHYSRLARLDGADLSTKESIEVAAGVKGYPAQKSFTTYRTIGHDGVRRAFELLAAADSDLRGGTGLDEDVVMDVLIARLARLAPTVSRRR